MRAMGSQDESDDLPARRDPTARNRHRAGAEPVAERLDAGKRKSMPPGLFDDIGLPAAPSKERPKAAAVAPRRPTGEQNALPRRPTGELTALPRRPGEILRETPEPEVPERPDTPLLEGADLFRAGAALPTIGKFGDYEVLGRLALGGMAEILLARAPDEERPIVLKKILATYDSDSEFVEMFLDEAHIGMQLDHPHIGRFLDAGEVDGRYYIAMEWVNGVTFGRLIRRGRQFDGLPARVACEIVAQIADALHYAHTSRDGEGTVMGLIHRDVSPHNIMVAYDGTVKLLDFGIAKAMVSAHTTGAGVVKGKFAYMAPEQCRGESVDSRIDIFALGVVLFEALIGKSLFRRDSDMETMQAIVNGPVPSLSDYLPGVPRELDAICRTALAKEPSARFPTAAAMRDVLRMYLERGPEIDQEDLSSLVQTYFAQELTRGPSVESTPFGSSYKVDKRTSVPTDPGPRHTAGPTLAPPPRGPDAPELPRMESGRPSLSRPLPSEKETRGYRAVSPEDDAHLASESPPPTKAPRSRAPALVVLALLLVAGLGLGAWFAFGGEKVGSLLISTQPAGATVLLDGRPSGTTPTAVNGVASGGHEVILQLEGHRDRSVAVEVVAGEIAEVSVTLESRLGAPGAR